MTPEDTEILSFKPEIEGNFIYIFNVVKTNDLSSKVPNIIISFNQYNYMHIFFIVSTEEKNVKFCYGSNFGSFIMPSLKSNNCVISILNPYIMYKDY